MRTVKSLMVPLLLAAASTCADELVLVNSQEYRVPDNKIWVIQSVEPADCRVCTSDLRLKGGLAIGNADELTLYGELEISFNHHSHQRLTLFPGTRFWLGDSRATLKVVESDR